LIRYDFISEKINSQTYRLANSFLNPKDYKKSIYFFPAFDEFIAAIKTEGQ